MIDIIEIAQLAGALEYTNCTSAEGERPSPQRVSWYDTKQSDGEVPVMFELWGMRSTLLLPSLPGSLWPGVVAPDKGPIYRLNRINGIFMLNWIVWLKMYTDSFKNNVVYKLFTFKSYIYIYIYYFIRSSIL